MVTNIPDVITGMLFEDPAPSNMSELGIITDGAKTPEFAVESRRKATFRTWPASNKKLASEMIEHQLFYTGLLNHDCRRCVKFP